MYEISAASFVINANKNLRDSVIAIYFILSESIDGINGLQEKKVLTIARGISQGRQNKKQIFRRK